MFSCWKAKFGSTMIPQVECVNYFLDVDFHETSQPPNSYVMENLTIADNNDDSEDVWNLTDHPTIVENLLPTLKRIWGYSFKPEQHQALCAVSEGQDVLVQMPTGGGKTLIFQIIAAVSSGLVVCVSSLKSLIKDQNNACYEHNINACFLYGTMDSLQKESIYYSLRQPTNRRWP